jgi:20S proteasome alpha/beta subunit
MTLVAGFKCQGGVVLCADTRETAEDIKLWVEKLSWYEQPWCQAGFGGSGHSDMIDMLVERIQAKLDKGYDNLRQVRNCIRLALHEGYEEEINPHPYPYAEKIVTLLIAVRPRGQQSVTLLKSTATVLHEVPAFELIGVGELVQYVARSLYSNDLSISQGKTLGVHLVSLAKKFVDGVDGDIHVLIVTSDGRIGIERVEYSQKQERFFEEFNVALTDLTLSCPDTSVSNKDVNRKLRTFASDVRGLRERYFRDVMNESLRHALSGKGQGDVFSRFPIGTTAEQGSSRSPRVHIPLSQGAQLAKILIDHAEAEKKPKARQTRKSDKPKHRPAKKPK